jgi:superfamily I DNA and RNA helicase
MVGQKDRWKALLENKDEEDTNFWVSTLPDELFSMAENLPEAQKFSAIVVDEGQDFHSTYWLPLQLLLQDPNEGSLYIFYDEAQRIYSLDEFPIKDGLTAVFNKNLRSTKPIGQFVADYYPGKDKFIPAGVESQQEVMIINPTKYADLPTALNDILNMLSEEGVPMQDVVILTMASEGRSQWQHGQKLASGFDLRWWHYNNKISGKRVLVSTIQAFKGLESAVVILTELDQASREDQADMLIYIGMSRAKNLLIILGNKPPLPAILK